MPNPSTRTFTDFGTGQTTVGTTAAQVSSTSLPAALVSIKALAANTGTVYVGDSSSVTSSTGYPLAAGEETPPLPVANVDDLYIIGSAANQTVAFLWLK